MKYYYLNKSSINERRRTLYNTRSSTSVDSTYGYLSTFQNWKPTYVDEDNQKWFNFNTQTFQFESKLLNLNLGLCINCHQRRLGLQISNNICGRCNKHNIAMQIKFYLHELMIKVKLCLKSQLNFHLSQLQKNY